jgi:hypothetical protein
MNFRSEEKDFLQPFSRSRSLTLHEVKKLFMFDEIEFECYDCDANRSENLIAARCSADKNC